MAKEVMVLTENELKTRFTLTEADIATLVWANNAVVKLTSPDIDDGAKADIVEQRNLKMASIVNIWEFKALCEKAVANIKATFSHLFNDGDAEKLPKNVSWKNNGKTSEFKDGASVAVIDSLLKKRLISKEQVYGCVTLSALTNATGLKKEFLDTTFPDVISETEKSKSLVIK